MHEINELLKSLVIPSSTKAKYSKHFSQHKVQFLKQRLRRLVELNKKIKSGFTKYRAFLLYGKTEGLKKWNSYLERQAYTNSKEYKNMTDEEFKNYNKSRATTRGTLKKLVLLKMTII